MAEAFLIRPAEARDVPTLGRLGALLLREHYEFDPQRFIAPTPNSEPGYGRFLQSQFDDPDTVVLVADQDGVVLGYVYAALEPQSWKDLRGPAGFIHDVVVSPEARGRRVGSELLEAASRWLVEHGAPRVLLFTAYKNEAAQRLFDKLGFRRTFVEMTREADAPAQKP